MTILPIDTKTMHPWHEISRLLINAKSLKVKAGGRVYSGAATLEGDDGHLTLVFKAKKAKK
jgi:hypothetical protein